MGFEEAVSLLRAHVEYLREQGVRTVPVSPARLEALRQKLGIKDASASNGGSANRSPPSPASRRSTSKTYAPTPPARGGPAAEGTATARQKPRAVGSAPVTPERPRGREPAETPGPDLSGTSRAESANSSRAVPKEAASPSSSPPKKGPTATGGETAVQQALFSFAPASPEGDSLARIAAEIAVCRKCRLCEGRRNVVPGQGRGDRPDIMFIGEGPGEDEDRQGLAFVGRAGQLLTQFIEGIGYKREDVFIGNIVKCRPPGNRTPLPDEMAACLPYLERQIALIRPRVIIALGATALKGLFGDPKISITRLRGKWLEYGGIPVMPTFHPAYVLRNPAAEGDVREDLNRVVERLAGPSV